MTDTSNVELSWLLDVVRVVAVGTSFSLSSMLLFLIL